jgi:uncharacterized Rmd1/YagE family protein
MVTQKREASTRVLRAAAWSLGNRIKAGLGPDRSGIGWVPHTEFGRDGGQWFLFRFGAFVAIGLTEAEEAELLEKVKPLVQDVHEYPGTEEVEIQLSQTLFEGVGTSGELILHNASSQRLELVAYILAKSAVLDYYESRFTSVFDRVEQLAAQLKAGHIPKNAKQLLKELGGALQIQAQMVGRVEVGIKPRWNWDAPELERLYERFATEFDLQEREAALSKKLELVSEVSITYLNLLHSNRSLNVEWYIVALIVVEMFLYLYEMFAKSG